MALLSADERGYILNVMLDLQPTRADKYRAVRALAHADRRWRHALLSLHRPEDCRLDKPKMRPFDVYAESFAAGSLTFATNLFLQHGFFAPLVRRLVASPFDHSRILTLLEQPFCRAAELSGHELTVYFQWHDPRRPALTHQPHLYADRYVDFSGDRRPYIRWYKTATQILLTFALSGRYPRLYRRLRHAYDSYYKR